MLEQVRSLVRTQVPHLEEDREMAPDIAKAIALVHCGQLTQVTQQAGLPGVG
jgi:histidine ammonia-lyase